MAELYHYLFVRFYQVDVHGVINLTKLLCRYLTSAVKEN